MVDLSFTIAAKSEQLNADDLLGGPRTVTITNVRGVQGDQPIAVNYEGDGGKPFCPCKTMRRVLVQVWGKDGKSYIGRSLTLFRDPAVTFGGLAVGGIRISHMSHINSPVEMALTATRGAKKAYKVHPLPDAPALEAPKPDAGRAKAETWVENQLVHVADAIDADALDAIMAAGNKAVTKLAREHADLHGRIQAAYEARSAELNGYGDDAPADAPHPADAWAARVEAAEFIADVMTVESEFARHREALNDADAERVEAAIGAAKKRMGK